MMDWPIIGVDESGKGDFFGPLVIAGVRVEEDQVGRLRELGVRDSKTIANGKVTALAERIKNLCVNDVIVINPEKYNQLYARIRNLNKLLGWGHARVIENVLNLGTAAAAISDKFGADRFITDNLQTKGRAIELVQMVRGEAHPAVAAASIVARAEFLRRMDMLSGSYAMDLPRGASAKVDEAGRVLVRERGEDVLNQVAKVHFKNYKKIL
jgi:ribonuclease HIII